MGRYIAQGDIENVYGATNVRKWSLGDEDGLSVNETRLTAAITYAEDHIDDRFRGGRYAIPFSTAPSIIKDAAAKIAGAWLYSTRGIQDYDDDANPVRMRQEEAEDMLDRVLSGQVTLSAAKATTRTSGIYIGGVPRG